MANEALPDYLKSASPNPEAARGPWFKNTAPAYAGIFLSVPFMAGMAGALAFGSISAALIGLVMGAFFCLVIYYVPAKLGMQTGMPLYVVASSTFGATGGIAIPGFLMGIVQIFWHAVFTMAASSFLMEAIGKAPQGPLYWVVCVVWGLSMAFVGAVGIGLLAKLSSWLPIFPLAFIALAAIVNLGGIGDFSTNISAAPGFAVGAALSLAIFAALNSTAGFFASAGVAGTDFGMNSRNENDVALGGFYGITIAAIVAGLLGMLAMAGAAGKNPEIAAQIVAGEQPTPIFIASISETGGLAKISYWVFLIACICPTGFCAFLASNAFATMLPKLPRVPMTLAAGGIGVILAATNIAGNLIGFFVMVGAAFGPIAGVMLADYVRSGGWKGPRKGINWAGYIAWAIGLVLGLLGALTGGKFGYGLEALIPMVVAAAAYFALAGMGLEPETIRLEEAKAE